MSNRYLYVGARLWPAHQRGPIVAYTTPDNAIAYNITSRPRGVEFSIEGLDGRWTLGEASTHLLLNYTEGNVKRWEHAQDLNQQIAELTVERDLIQFETYQLKDTTNEAE